MKTKKGFNIREVCGEHIIVPEGKENIDFSCVISMNETAAFLWKNIQGKSFTKTELIELLTANYEVDQDSATRDVEMLIEKWIKIGMIESD
ncbi:MAG: PqqD family protein [Prevotella sp.]